MMSAKPKVTISDFDLYQYYRLYGPYACATAFGVSIRAIDKRIRPYRRESFQRLSWLPEEKVFKGRYLLMRVNGLSRMQFSASWGDGDQFYVVADASVRSEVRELWDRYIRPFFGWAWYFEIDIEPSDWDAYLEMPGSYDYLEEGRCDILRRPPYGVKGPIPYNGWR